MPLTITPVGTSIRDAQRTAGERVRRFCHGFCDAFLGGRRAVQQHGVAGRRPHGGVADAAANPASATRTGSGASPPHRQEGGVLGRSGSVTGARQANRSQT